MGVQQEGPGGRVGDRHQSGAMGERLNKADAAARRLGMVNSVKMWARGSCIVQKSRESEIEGKGMVASKSALLVT